MRRQLALAVDALAASGLLTWETFREHVWALTVTRKAAIARATMPRTAVETVLPDLGTWMPSARRPGRRAKETVSSHSFESRSKRVPRPYPYNESPTSKPQPPKRPICRNKR